VCSSDLHDEAAAWRALATLWAPAAAPEPPCAPGQALRCHRATLTLAQIRQLARPGLLLLHEEADGPGRGAPGYALLLGLDDQQALLRPGDGGAAEAVPLAQLARWWRGEFATLWRAPQGLPEGTLDASQPALAAWLGEQLDRLPDANARDERPLRQRIAAFQLAQGLKPDGVPGPMTLMQLNRAAGVQEPRLRGTGS
jgi:general secretion pathway protein A